MCFSCDCLPFSVKPLAFVPAPRPFAVALARNWAHGERTGGRHERRQRREAGTVAVSEDRRLAEGVTDRRRIRAPVGATSAAGRSVGQKSTPQRSRRRNVCGRCEALRQAQGLSAQLLKPRARSEGMATRRGVWQVATTPPDLYALGMGVPKALTAVCGRCVWLWLWLLWRRTVGDAVSRDGIRWPRGCWAARAARFVTAGPRRARGRATVLGVESPAPAERSAQSVRQVAPPM